MYSIGEVSRRTGVKIPTIRYYEQIGLIDAPGRSGGNQRLFSQEGLRQLSFIRHSRDMRFSLSDARELLALSRHPEAGCSDAHSIAVRHLARVRAKISRMKRLEKELKRIAVCEAGKLADCTVLETLEDHRLCSGEH